MTGRIAFADCLAHALADPELVANFDRLRGTNVALRGSPLDLMIDHASGRTAADLALFAEFVRECVWERLPIDTTENGDDA